MILKGIHFSTCTCDLSARGTILLGEMFISTTEALCRGSFFTRFYFLFNLAIRRVECITQGSPRTRNGDAGASVGV